MVDDFRCIFRSDIILYAGVSTSVNIFSVLIPPSMGNLLMHGGVGATAESEAPLSELLNGFAKKAYDQASSLESVINSTVLMEDDEHFNAGTGSTKRLDGSIQMDASVMTEAGFGSVIAVERVKNPVKLARDVMEKTPHLAMAGDGAQKLARVLGYPDHDPNTKKAEDRLDKILAELKDEGAAPNPRIDKFRSFGNLSEFLKSCDTVGAVGYVNGKFAAAVSTGGASPMLRGRVGDSPLPGAGIFCGEKGAVVATGIGEEIISHMLCISVYNEIGTAPLGDILDRKIAPFKGPVGVIAVDKDGCEYRANKPMPVGIYKAD